MVWLPLVLGCRPSPDSFYDKLYTCDSTVTPDDCGTDRRNRPMACFAARQLGAQDFCAETCDGADPSDDSVCVSSGVRLASCRPSQDQPAAGNPSSCGDPSLRCLRTDLLEDEGVCTTVAPCSADTDCGNPRRFCASTLLRAMYGSSASFASDHLFCVQAGCLQTGSSCPSGESCLPNVVHAQTQPPDICVPDCDPNLNCPPSYACYRKVSGPAVAAVCIPGLMGFRCSGNNDCLVGDCVDTGAGFNICTTPCTDTSECARFDGTRGTVTCASLTPGGPRYCTTPSAFKGADCRDDGDCQPPEICSVYSPYSTQSDTGTCLLPCDAAGGCPARGGLPHTCLDFLDRPVCYPGDFGIYCRSGADCAGDLSCLTVADLDASDAPTTAPRCSIACTQDQDCRNDPLVARWGWCNQGSCVPPRGGNRVCERPIECWSGVCQPSILPQDQGKSVLRCTYPPGGA